MEGTYQIMEWSYDCTALNVDGLPFRYSVSCYSYAMQGNLSLYNDVDCKMSAGAKPTNAEGILTLEVRIYVRIGVDLRHFRNTSPT